LFTPIIKKHKELLDPNNPKDLLDHLLIHQQEHGWGDDALMANCVDTFGGGSDSSANTISWTIAYLIKYPEIQKKLQQEVDKYLPKTKIPTLDDVPNLPYLNATIQEVMRIMPEIPLSIPHRTTAPAMLGGYDIPENVMIIPNIYALQNSPKYWGNDTKEFRPERFLNFDSQDVRLSPFGIGQRQCAGMKIAKQSVIQVIGSIIQKYNFLPPNDTEEFKIPEIVFGIVVAPAPYAFRVVKRS